VYPNIENLKMPVISSLQNLDAKRFEATAILKKLATTSRKLAELKGMAASIPNQSILINTLSLQEAKESSAIENIVTTFDQIFKNDVIPQEKYVNTADGRVGYSLDCSGTARNWGMCERKAGELCGTRGYNILSASGDSGAILTAGGGNVFAGTTISRTMLIACK